MDRERIAERLRPFLEDASAPALVLSEHQLSSISTYLDILLRWNARVNLTAIRDPEEILTRHFGESLFAARHLFPEMRSTVHVIDVGSGAGFPGLPIKLWARDIHLTLIESNNKKATFLREAIRSLKLEDAEVFAGRAEEFSASADVVTLRAVERFESVLPTAISLVVPGGRIVLLSSVSQNEIIAMATGISWREGVPIPKSERRILNIGRRILNANDSKS